ncbi:MAG: type II toxin-antitoxin system prevent-host-death family antitoxin [Pseudonocardiales bacterium]|nr:type II toxin-antitoxin system prevent-host-death family antitoxin [Pseudonocardiales bacterium]
MRTIRFMTVRVGIRELRDRLSGFLERARAGESIEITDRGRPIAMLVPLPASRATVAELVASGRLRLAERTWRPGARRVNAPAGAQPPSEHVREMRDERI